MAGGRTVQHPNNRVKVMASIFEGVPFITQLPTVRHVDVATPFIQGFRAATEKRSVDSQNRVREMTAESLINAREAQITLAEARLDQVRNESADRATLAQVLPLLQKDPENAPMPEFRTTGSMELFLKLRGGAMDRKMAAKREELRQQQLRQELEAGIISGLTPTANTQLFIERQRNIAAETGDTEMLSVLDKMEKQLSPSQSGTVRLSEEQKAQLEVAKKEFQDATEVIDPSDPAYQEAKQKYLRQVQSIAPGTSVDAVGVLNKAGYSTDEFQSILRNMAESFKEGQR